MIAQGGLLFHLQMGLHRICNLLLNPLGLSVCWTEYLDTLYDMSDKYLDGCAMAEQEVEA